MRVCAMVMLAISTAAVVFGQGRATILGAITDESGGIVPRATITIINTGTQQRRMTEADERGQFEVPSLDIGFYDITAEAAGFQRAVVRGVRLEVDQRARVDLQLKVGEVTQSVEVQAAGAVLQTDDATVADGRLGADQRNLARWFDTAAFVTARGHYGNSGRNVLTAPGLTNLDFAVFKNFPITETKAIQFRWENYNFTNTPPFDPPTLEISSGNFGRITSAGLGREMQFALRFQF